MYCDPDFKTKKALKEAVAAGREVSVFQPVLGSVPSNGKVYLEGPHFVAHTWYAEAWLKDGLVVKVR